MNTDGSITNNGNKTTYGLISESRIIKNLEWAAVAYLSHSKYGINKEIRINNNSNYITGCGASAENGNSISACQIVYGAVSSYPQSTTGNISGVFDMSGGSYEYVMGVMEDSLNSGNPASGYSASTNSGFNGKYTGGGIKTDGTNFPNPKYYNLYKYGTTYNDNAAYNRTIVGDALKETMRWYNDYSYVVYSSSPWFHRGGGHDNKEMGGIFYSSRTSGEAIDKISFRVVVTITE